MKQFLRNCLLPEKRSGLHALLIVSGFSTILALIPVFYTWGKLNVGGDVLIPLGSYGLEKYLHHWILSADGIYFALNYYPYYWCYIVFESLHLSIYQISSVLFIALSVIAGTGIYKICSLFYECKSPYDYFTPITFYLFSPALLNGWHYNIIYAFIPWTIYFIFKAVKNNKIGLGDVVWISIIVFVCSMDLPNPKYIFHLYLIAILIILGGFALRLIEASFFKLNWKKLVIHVLLSAHIFIPMAYFATHYSADEYGVQVRSGDQSTGQMGDYGTATIDRMFKLHHDNIYLNTKDADRYTKNSLVSFLSYLFLFIAVLTFLSKRDKSDSKKEFELILLGLIVIYIFLAVGPNPPLGFIYEYLVMALPLLAFLRTTAGAVFYLSLFYTILLFIFLANLKRHKIKTTLLVLAALSVVSYPLINGEYYKNFNGNQYADIEQRGYKIPDAYFRVKDALDSLRLDAKIYYPNSNLTYLNTTWGYFGPVIYNFIYKNSNIGFDKVMGNPALHNIGFLYQDRALFGQDHHDDNLKKGSLIVKDKFIEIARTSRKEFLPHFYTPTKLLLSDDPAEMLAERASSPSFPLRTAVLDALNFPAENVSALNTMRTPHLEFRRIDATRYQIRIHGAITPFPLVFSEKYNAGWKVYVGSMRNAEDGRRDLTDYKILDGNEEDQATVEEIRDYLQQGFIATLGDGKEKIFHHKKWENEREVPSYSEKYRIDFISKNYQGTIQNDNLPPGYFYETWLKNPLPEKAHFKANGYANGWIIETEQICQSTPTVCARNSNGTYDLELIVEFWPQKLYYLCIIISMTTLLSCLGYFLHSFINRVMRRPFLLE